MLLISDSMDHLCFSILKVFGLFMVQEWVPRAQKSKNEKKHHKFTQAISLPNFRQI